MEHKSMSNVVSQAKQVELQIVHQQEGLVSREAQLVLQLTKLQEDVRGSLHVNLGTFSLL